MANVAISRDLIPADAFQVWNQLAISSMDLPGPEHQNLSATRQLVMMSIEKPVTGQCRSFYADINSYRIFIEINGQGPYMIMSHGLGTSSNVFQPLVEIYESRFTIVRFDWPGLGNSKLNETSERQHLTVPSLLGVFEGLLQLLNVESAIFVGHSLGGVISMHLAAKHPESARGLVVIGSGRSKAQDITARRAIQAQAALARTAGMKGVLEYRLWLNIPSKKSFLERAFLRQVTGSTNPEGYAQICEALCDITHVDPDYTRISCPTCIVSGRFDMISPPGVALDLKMEISKGGNVPHTYMLETGHMQILEDVHGVSQAIESVLPITPCI